MESRHDVTRSPKDVGFNGTKGSRIALRLLSLAWLFAVVTGCQTLTIPRIDPTGQRIFLPDPYRVGLSDVFTHTDRNGQPTRSGIFPEPAYQTPPSPPACLDGSGNCRNPLCKSCCSKLLADKGERGQLLLTPLNIVAPVGGEVVLLAGICGEDGYLLTREPLEWMLTPDSVGTFLEVGDDLKGRPLKQWHTKVKVEKRDVDYAKGRTSSKETTITRGTECKDDDLILKKGQTWISLSSPTEGVSRVTALAPDSEIWDRRRQTATIYWVDARWVFPQPVTVLSGQPAMLVTQVFQAEGFVAARGWKVIYRSLNPEVARFLPDNRVNINEDDRARISEEGRVAETTVDADGRATVQLQNISGNANAAVIAMEVVRPAQPSEKMAALPLGNGQTVVTWSAPKLMIQAGGPELGVPKQLLTYNASLTNVGDLPAENVELNVDIPVGMNIQSVEPDDPNRTIKTPQRVTWQIGSLPPGQRLNVSIGLVPQGNGDVNVIFTGKGIAGSGAGSILAEDTRSLRLIVDQPAVNVSIVPADGGQVELGRETSFNVIVTNVGRNALNNLKVQVVSDAGLQEASSNQSRVEQAIPYLGPGQKRELQLRYIVRRVGELTAQANVLANDALIGSSNKVFVRGAEGAPKVPAISLNIIPKGNAADNSLLTTREIDIVVKNTGQTSLTSVQLEVNYDPELEATKATKPDQFRPNERYLAWKAPAPILPGDSNVFTIEFAPTPLPGGGNPPRQASVRARVRSNENVEGSNGFTFSIGGQGGGNAGNNVLPGAGGSSGFPNNPPPNNPGNNSILPSNPNGSVLPGGGFKPVLSPERNLTLEITRNTETVVANKVAIYTITLKNASEQDERNVVLHVSTPENVQLDGLNPFQQNLRTNYRGIGSASSEPILFLRSGETLSWQLKVTAKSPMEFTVRAQASSEGQEEPTTKEITSVALPN